MDRRERRRVSRLTTFGGGRAVRWDRCDYCGDEVIHLTLCAERGTPFTDERLARLVCDNVARACELRGYRLFGFCLMPDHLHVLLSPAKSGCPVGRWLNGFKSFTGHEFVRLGGQPPLWQRSAYDHVCRDGETAEAVVRYIAENPIRAGLVADWRDWPWTRVFVDL
jgi:REP element-mobilizing transposase RayT